MKVSPRVEKIFARAVALEQSGRMRNTVFCLRNRIYILNFDHTVLIRFLLPKEERTFDSPIAFMANDYDGASIDEENGKIIFRTTSGGFAKSKTCSVPERTPEQVEDIWKKMSAMEREVEDGSWIPFPKTLISGGLLEEGLSHVEFVGRAGNPVKIIQRDIYSGSKIEIQEDPKLLISNKVGHDFGPIAVRTADLIALFGFGDVLKIRFIKGPSVDFLRFGNDSRTVITEGFIGCCLYDEMFETKTVIKAEGESHGRQEQKDRRSEQETHPEAERGAAKKILQRRRR